MSKRSTFTTITPLPQGTTRETVIEFLHDHHEMMDLNPLVIDRYRIKTPPHATPDEFHCIWYSLTDEISYLPGIAKGNVTYTAAFHDLPNGIQTHCYAPAGVVIQNKWTVNGTLPGEPVEPVELGIGAPLTGLYIREDVDMKANVLMSSFVKKNLKRSHATLIERLKVKAQIAAAAETNARLASGQTPVPSDQTRHSLGAATSATPVPASVQSPVPSPYHSPPPPTAQPSAFPNPRYSLAPEPSPSYAELSSQPERPLSASYTSPPQSHEQHSSPPPYGRCEPSAAQAPPQPHFRPRLTYQQQQLQLQLQHQQQSAPAGYDLVRDTVPESLRIRQNSASSSTSSGAPTPNPNPHPDRSSVYRDAQGRVSWSTISKNSLSPPAVGSVQYRSGNPDYPQMNPCAGYGQATAADRQAQQTQTYLDGPGGAGSGHCAAGLACQGSELRGAPSQPLLAEMEG